MKKRRTNKAKRLVSQPRFRPKVETPEKGPGAYQRKQKHKKNPEKED